MSTDRPQSDSATRSHRTGLAALVANDFDSVWYVAAYPEVADLVRRGSVRSPLDHYVTSGCAESNSPNATFDEQWYLATYPDVADAVRNGRLKCGFEHYLLCGREEARKPMPEPSVSCTVDSVIGNEIHGWATDKLAPSESVELRFFVSDQPVGAATANQMRPDLLAVLPDGAHGFSFAIPRAYCDGVARRVRIENAKGRRMSVTSGRTGAPLHELLFEHRYDDPLNTAVSASERLDEIAQKLDELRSHLDLVQRLASFAMSDYRYLYERFYKLSSSDVADLRRTAGKLSDQPLISVVLPAHDANPELLDAAIRSVVDQAYPRWELCISDDGSADEAVREVIRTRASRDSRIKYTFSHDAKGIASNTSRALAMATGDYVAFLDHDDMLTPDALYCVALALQKRRYSLLYSDEDLVDLGGRPVRPHLKPDFNYDLLLGVNYMCHLLVVERAFLEQIGGLRDGFDGCQDRDLVLRALEACKEADILHIPRVLYHWRVNRESVSQTQSNRQQIMKRTKECVQEHLDRTGQRGAALAGDSALFSCRVAWELPSPTPQVAIIIPTKDRLDLLGPCVQGILDRTLYAELSVVIVDHDSEDGGTRSHLDLLQRDSRVQVLRYSGRFNWSAINNFAASKVAGDVLCFLNNDVLIADENWLTELASNAIRPDVGAVGAKLLYEDGTVQHAGVVLGVSGFAGHAFHHLRGDDGGYLGRAKLAQQVSAVTGACLCTRREVFEEVGGFNAIDFGIALNDVDYCLRVQELGYSVVMTPYAPIIHLESKSRGLDVNAPEKSARLSTEATKLRDRWSEWLDRDPHYNPHFDLHAPPYERLRLPKRIWTEEDQEEATRPLSNVLALSAGRVGDKTPTTSARTASKSK